MKKYFYIDEECEGKCGIRTTRICNTVVIFLTCEESVRKIGDAVLKCRNSVTIVAKNEAIK